MFSLIRGKKKRKLIISSVLLTQSYIKILLKVFEWVETVSAYRTHIYNLVNPYLHQLYKPLKQNV